jgi:SAM-dependent methyltransferase
VDAITEGHYYRKQLGCKSGVIAWSHRSRFRAGLRLLGPAARRLLDYGCGDGTFLAMAAGRIGEGWGVDIAADQIKDCQERLAALSNVRFRGIGELHGELPDASCDVVTCLETLEHCTPATVEAVLRDLARMASPDGRVVISVPIEIGPTFLLKSVIRKAAAWRGLSDYRYYESYSLGDAVRMIFANRRTALNRPVYGTPDAPWHSHYGFNWRALRERVRAHFAVEQTLFSPLGSSGGWVSSQAWFVCRPRPASPPVAA